MEHNRKKPSYRQRWDQARVAKKVVFWFALAAVVLTLIVGFSWGGWVTGGSAQTMADDAVVQRLSEVCVAQFDQDPGKAQKLSEMKEQRAYKHDDYVKEQGWATMPGEEKADSQVAVACARLLVQVRQ